MGRVAVLPAAYPRVDTVKGVYHLNAVDAVGCTPRTNATYLEPVLEAMLDQFPFPSLGSHTDNGSEFINHTVANLLNKLLSEFSGSHRWR